MKNSFLNKDCQLELIKTKIEALLFGQSSRTSTAADHSKKQKENSMNPTVSVIGSNVISDESISDNLQIPCYNPQYTLVQQMEAEF